MIKGRDSAFPPTRAQAAAAASNGVRVWGGYLPLAGAYHGWSPADFATAEIVGAVIAYAFPAADPVAARAAANGVRGRLILDNARGDTFDPFAATTAQWLAAAGPCGMYGQPDVLAHWRGHMSSAVACTRPGHDPGTNDPGLGLGIITGNQWTGGVTENGLGVDMGTYDDAFGVRRGGAPPPPSLPRPVPPPAPPIDAVTVRPGDTFSGIAAAHGVQLNALEDANPGLERGHQWALIYPGDLVHLPGGSQAPAPKPIVRGGRVYLVRPGDTLSGIATAYHIPLGELESMNPGLQRGAHRWGLVYPGDAVHLP